MITIIEGTDATGKTTYAKKLAEKTGAQYIHTGAPSEIDYLKEYYWSLSPTKDYVLDRWHVGEMIWPSYFNRKSLFPDLVGFNLCNYFLSTLNTKIIIVQRNTDDIAATLTTRGEQDQIETCVAAQKDFINLSFQIKHVPVEIIDSNDLHEKEN